MISRHRHQPAGPGRPRRQRGQSLAEFALILPVLLLLVLMTIDFGRLFYSWITITNSARVAANYAAINPDKLFGPGSEYANLVNGEGFAALGTTCTAVPAGVPVPVFADTATDTNATTNNMGDTVTVVLSCNFRIFTPIVSAVVGGSVPMTASSTFTVSDGVYMP
ncbi:MAG TPA: TadE/TadG family type IV pilus assembly protein [Candidatus Limnocylindrales bacterium]|nr:TadE/TadG family type IV pilus assembly protein [Candidatus Limnocylindrales bacterium]